MRQVCAAESLSSTMEYFTLLDNELQPCWCFSFVIYSIAVVLSVGIFHNSRRPCGMSCEGTSTVARPLTC